jgi:hypothetical protein
MADNQHMLKLNGRNVREALDAVEPVPTPAGGKDVAAKRHANPRSPKRIELAVFNKI